MKTWTLASKGGASLLKKTNGSCCAALPHVLIYCHSALYIRPGHGAVRLSAATGRAAGRPRSRRAKLRLRAPRPTDKARRFLEFSRRARSFTFVFSVHLCFVFPFLLLLLLLLSLPRRSVSLVARRVDLFQLFLLGPTGAGGD